MSDERADLSLNLLRAIRATQDGPAGSWTRSSRASVLSSALSPG